LTGKVELMEIKPDQVKEITKQTIEGNGQTTATGIEIVKSKELYVQKIARDFISLQELELLYFRLKFRKIS
jgi:hypothetical protein